MTRASQLLPCGRRGFTLIEVVVAMALGVLLLTAVLGLVVRSRQLHDRFMQQARGQDLLAAPLRILADDLRAAGPGAAIDLRDGSLTFDTVNAMHSTRLVPREQTRVRFALVPDAGHAARIVRMEHPRGAFDGPDAASMPLGGSVEELQIRAFDGREWHAERRTEAAWPVVAIAVEIRFEPQDEVTRHVFPIRPPPWRHHQAR